MPREIVSHIVNPANDKLKVVALDGPGHGGASHQYEISGFDNGDGDNSVVLEFQSGPIGENGNGVNGITHEALLAVLIDRLEGFQGGPYANDFNKTALDYLYGAQTALLQRTRERMARGVEGTHKV